MGRYLQVVDGIATSENHGDSMPPVVAECMTCIQASDGATLTNDQRQQLTWNPQVDPPDGLVAWQDLHKGHTIRLKTIVEASAQPIAKVGMAYDAVKGTFSDVVVVVVPPVIDGA